MPIRILIVDDHAITRSGLVALVLAYDDLELVGEAANGKQALDLCTEHQPDVVLMDLVMPEIDGPTAIQAIKEHYPQIQIVALTSFAEEELIQRTLQAGAIAYMLKNVSADALANAIRAARAGEPTLAPEAIYVLNRQQPSHPPSGATDARQRPP